MQVQFYNTRNINVHIFKNKCLLMSILIKSAELPTHQLHHDPSTLCPTYKCISNPKELPYNNSRSLMLNLGSSPTPRFPTHAHVHCCFCLLLPLLIAMQRRQHSLTCIHAHGNVANDCRLQIKSRGLQAVISHLLQTSNSPSTHPLL